jgi:hypothetical protein
MADDPQNNNGPKKEDNKEELTVLSRIIQELQENRETDEDIEQRRIRREKALRRIRLTLEAAVWAVRYRKNHKDISLANELARQRYDKQIEIGETSEEDLQQIDHDIKNIPRALGEFLTGNEESSNGESIELLKRIANGVEGNFKTAEGKPQNGGNDDGGPLKKKGPGVFSRVGKAIGDVIGSVIEGIGNAFANIGKKAFKVLKGALAVAAIGVSLIPAALAFQMFSEVSWGGVAAGLVVLTALVVGVMALGAIMSSGIGTVAILAGAAALAILGVAMIPAAKAFEMFGKALNDHVAPALKQFAEVFSSWILTLTTGFSSVLTSIGTFANDMTEAFGNVVTSLSDGFAKVITTLGETFATISTAVGEFISGTIDTLVSAFEKGVDSIGGFVTVLVGEIKELASLDGGSLLGVAGGITAVGLALGAFAASGSVGGAIKSIGSTFSKLLGDKSPIDQLTAIADLGPRLKESIKPIEELPDLLMRLGDALADGFDDNIEATGNAIKTMLDQVDDGLDQLNMKKLDKISGIIINTTAGVTQSAQAEGMANQQAGLGSIISSVSSNSPSVNNVTYNDHGLMDRTAAHLGSLN